MSGITKDMSRSERLAVIREAAERFKQKKANEGRIIRDYTASYAVEKDVNDDFNVNHWTDASKYAEEYYGDTMRATTRFDNDWD